MLSSAEAQVRAQSGTAQAADTDAAARRIVELVNDFRAKHRLRPVAVQPQLTTAAASFASYMARTERFGHEADGTTPSQRASAQGYDYCVISENIGYQFHSGGFETGRLAAALVSGWQDSPSHRAAMLDADVSETGVGITRSASGRYYAVQLFGRPRADSIDFRVTNRTAANVSYAVDGQTFQLPPRATRSHQQCRGAQMTLQAPRTLPAVRIAGGERFAVVGDADVQLVVEQP